MADAAFTPDAGSREDIDQDGPDRGDLLRILDEEASTGITFANDAKTDRREHALEYYDGEMDDLKAAPNRSSFVSRDVAEVIDKRLPGLLRIFDGTDRVVKYSPAKQADEEHAEQATDYVNHVWINECDGFTVLLTAIMDALQVRNGIIKTYWDPTPEYSVETLTNLTDLQLVQVMGAPEMGIPGDPTIDPDLLGYTSRQALIAGAPMTLHDLKVKRITQTGRLRCENVPPEDFGISSNAKDIDTAPWVWHRSRLTRSALRERGLSKTLVDSLPAYAGRPYDRLNRGQGDPDPFTSGTEGRGAMEEVEITEWYGFYDEDGDGIAEPVKVETAGAPGALKLISCESWGDERPFADLRPHIVPHRWMGRSDADNTMDLQRVKTALWRGLLDNLYGQNKPQRAVNQQMIVNPEEVINPVFGGIIRTKGDPRAAIADLPTPDISGSAIQGLAIVDNVIERRTGVARATAALDPNALNPQTATAEQIEHDQDYARTELVARIMARTGMRKLFSKMLKIIVANQDRPRTIQIRGKWVEYDPRPWNANMDAKVDVGLGTGSRERDLAMLNMILQQQMAIFKQYGPDNPVVTVPMIVATLHKIVEASGLRDPESYFASISDEALAMWRQQHPTPPPLPVQVAQARAQGAIQVEQVRSQSRGQEIMAKVQATLQGKQAGAAIDLERDKVRAAQAADQSRVDAANDVAIEREKLEANRQAATADTAADLALQRDRLAQEYDLRVQEMDRQLETDLYELEMEAQLRAREMAMGLTNSVNLRRPN